MSRPSLAWFPTTALAAALALASGCAHQEPPSVDASPSAEATAALAPVTPFPPPVARDPAPATTTVRRPKPNSVVVFCGMDAATANQPVVKGTMPGSSEAAGLRVLVFSASGS